MNRRVFLQRLMLTLAASPALTLLGSTATPASAAPPTPTPSPQPQDDIPHRVAYLSQPRSGMGTAVAGQTVLFIGGETNGSPSAAVDLFDGEAGTWSTAALSEPRVGVRPVVVGDLLLLAGGTDRTGQRSPIVDIYDGRTGAWSTAELSRPFGTAGSAMTPGVVVIGRRAIFVHADVADIFDADTGAWTAQPLAEARTSAALAVVGQTLMIAGGAIDGRRPSATVDIYDTHTGDWRAAQLSRARAGVAAGVAGSTAIFAGGVVAGYHRDHPLPQGFPVQVVDYYDAATDTWTVGELSGTFENRTGKPDYNRWETYNPYSVMGAGNVAVITSDRDTHDARDATFDVYDAATGTQRSILLPGLLSVKQARVVGNNLVVPIGGAWTVLALVVIDLDTGRQSVVPMAPQWGRARPLDDSFDWLDVQTAQEIRAYYWNVVDGSRLVLGGGARVQVGPPPSSTPADTVDVYDVDDDSWVSIPTGERGDEMSAVRVGSVVLTGTGRNLHTVNLDTGALDGRPTTDPVTSTWKATAGRFLLSVGGPFEEPTTPMSPFTPNQSFWGMAPPPGISGAVQYVDSQTGVWSEARLSVPRRDFTIAMLSSTTMFVGGYDAASGSSDVVDLYDTRTGTVQTEHLPVQATRGQIMRRPLGQSGVALLIDVRPLRSGGGRHLVSQTHLQMYDDEARRWWSAPLSVARTDAMLGTVGTLALAVGGRDLDTLEPMDVVDLFDVRTGTAWSARLSEPRAYPLVATAGSKLVVVDRYGSTTADIFDVDTGAWTTTTLPESLGPPPNDLAVEWSAAGVGDKVVFSLYLDQNMVPSSPGSVVRRFAPLAVFDTRAGTWTFSQAPFSGTIAPVAVGGKLLYAPRLGEQKAVFDAATGEWSTPGSYARLEHPDPVAILADRWALFDSPYMRTGLAIYDAAANTWVPEALPAELSAGNYGSVVLRPPDYSDSDEKTPLRVLGLATGQHRELRLAVPRDRPATIQVGGRVLVAGGEPYSALVDVFDVPGPRMDGQ